jgi:hypothetical protein
MAFKLFTDKSGPIKMHALARARERIDPQATMFDLLHFAIAIRDGGGTTFASRKSKKITIHHVEREGVVWKVIYDNRRGLVKTITRLNRE